MNTITDSPQDLEVQPAPASFNEAQRLRFRAGCEYIDKLLREIESILHSGESASPFSRYLMDVSPAQGRVIEDYIRSLRAQLLSALTWQHMEPSRPTIPATRSIEVHLSFVDIALADLRPREMRGSGALSEVTARELTGVLGELTSIAGQMMTYLKYDLEQSFQQRVEKISPGSQDLLLQRVEQVITGRGLVEFRSRLDLLLARLEEKTFEVAVFGRVSSGKSSFLNALLGLDLLPVGVNPITAVPTRIQYGESIRASVRIGNGVLGEVPPERFRAFISEAGNPGNQQCVRQALLEVPSERLAIGIVLVDTPGLGSLALEGSRETLAYLPSCDLALVLVDAGNTLTQEDIGTLRLLQEAGIPALVLLSKSDLVKPSERKSSIAYVKAQLLEQLRASLEVYPISSLSTWAFMVTELYHGQLEARFHRAQELKALSIQTKLSRLRNDLVASLQTRVQRLESAHPLEASTAHDLANKLLDASARLGVLDRTVEDHILRLTVNAPAVVDQTSKALTARAKVRSSSLIALSEGRDIAQTLVEREIEELVAMIERSIGEVLSLIRDVGQDLESSGLPDEREILGLIRDAPRFAMPALSGMVELGIWSFLGHRAVSHRIAKAVRLAAEPSLKRELGLYGPVLESWAKHLLRNIRFAVDSFANVYRASLQQSERTKDPVREAALIREDMTLLRTVV